MNFKTKESKKVSSTVKKEFVAPKLEVLGSVVDITRGPQGGSADGLFGGTGGFQTTTPIS